MSSSFLPRQLIILGIVLPIAVFVGFNIADPSADSLNIVLILVGILAAPAVLKWHHPLLIFSWNLPVMLFFLPGDPYLWMTLSFVSMGVSIVGTILDKERKLIHVPVMTAAMIALALVVLFTMKMTGSGLGLRSFGGNFQGAKKYFYILFAVMGYFAMSCQRFPVAKANQYAAMFFLPAAASVLSNFIYLLGPGFWFLYHLIPVDMALNQAVDDFVVDPYSLRFGRITGLALAGPAIFSYILARYGLAGTFNVRKPWRAAALVLVAFLGLLGGFRSVLLVYGLLFIIQFFLEGLHKTRLTPALAAIGLVGFLALIPLADKLPLSVQRCISVLPLVDVNPAVKAETKGSTEWRMRMWQVAAPQIPKYFWVGKGVTMGAADSYLTMHATRFGFAQDFEASLVAGDYHNGPLSVMIPYGIWGVLAFLFFIGASLHVLITNYRHGDPAVRHINTFLLTAFIGRLAFFFVIFGALHIDMITFAGLVGFSISLNGGVRRRSILAPVVEQPVKQAVPVRVRPVIGRY